MHFAHSHYKKVALHEAKKLKQKLEQNKDNSELLTEES